MLRDCWECSGAGKVLRYFKGWVEIDRASYERLMARPDLARSAQEPMARDLACPRCKGSGRIEVVPDGLSYLRPQT